MITVGELKEFLKDFDDYCKVRYDDDEFTVYWSEQNGEGDDVEFEESFEPKPQEPSPFFSPCLAFCMNESVKNLIAQTPFSSVLDRKPIPVFSGKEIQFFNYSVVPEEVK